MVRRVLVVVLLLTENLHEKQAVLVVRDAGNVIVNSRQKNAEKK